MKRINLKNLEEQYHKATDQEREEIIDKVKRSIKRKNNFLSSMMDIVERKVGSYKVDFYIYDMQLIHRYDVSFLWIIKETGTNWIDLEVDIELTDGKSANLEYYNTLLKMTRVKEIYHFDKRRKVIQRITKEKALTLVKNNFEKMAV